MSAKLSGLPPRPKQWTGLALGAIVAAGMGLLFALGVEPSDLASLRDVGPYLSRYGTPEVPDSRLLFLMLETIVMGLWGSILTVLFAIPLTAWAARSASASPFGYRLSREVLNFCRAMPDLLLALIFVTGFGIGPLPGVLALGIHSSGYVGKVIADAMERVPRGVVEGVASTGASRLQIVRFALWPSVSREIVGASLYIVDRNIRVATTLGLVGAGGIGVELQQSLRLFRYDRAAAILALIVVTIVAIDAASSALRRRMGT